MRCITHSFCLLYLQRQTSSIALFMLRFLWIIIHWYTAAAVECDDGSGTSTVVMLIVMQRWNDLLRTTLTHSISTVCVIFMLYEMTIPICSNDHSDDVHVQTTGDSFVVIYSRHRCLLNITDWHWLDDFTDICTWTFMNINKKQSPTVLFFRRAEISPSTVWLLWLLSRLAVSVGRGACKTKYNHVIASL